MDGRLKIVAIACNDRESDLRKAIRDYDIPWESYMDADKLSYRYGVNGFPTKILIDPQGKILFRYEGEHENFYKEILNYL